MHVVPDRKVLHGESTELIVISNYRYGSGIKAGPSEKANFNFMVWDEIPGIEKRKAVPMGRKQLNLTSWAGAGHELKLFSTFQVVTPFLLLNQEGFFLKS
jgi:hypothetical protein